MFRAIWLSVLTLLFCVSLAQAQTEAIPSCPYPRGAFYNAEHFPRYDFHSQRVVMVDLATREEVRELGTGIPAQNYWVQTWSPECQYLSMAFSYTNEQGVEFWDTIIWDVVNGGEIGRFEGARLVPFPMTWDTNSTQVLVETRFGAYLWKLGGGQVWLTTEGDYNGRSFRQGTLKWDYANNQLSGVLSIPPSGSALYDMGTGALLAITDQWDRPLELGTRQTFFADGDGERYRCTARGRDGLQVTYNVPTDRLVLQDANTHDVVLVLDEKLAELVVSTGLYQVEWRDDCRFLLVRFSERWSEQQDLFVYDLQTNRRLLFVPYSRVRQPHIDPTGQYMVVTTDLRANLYHLNTGAVFPLSANVYSDHYNVERAFRDLKWDVENNQLQITVEQRSNRTQTIQVHDLQTGALIQTLDTKTGEAHLSANLELLEDQRTSPYGCTWFAQYRPQLQSIVLVHNFSRKVLGVVEDNLLMDSFSNPSKSADCRYLIGTIRTGNTYDTVAWDLASGERVGTFAGAQNIAYPITYSPYGNYAVISTSEGAFLWHYPTDTRHQLNDVSITPPSGRKDIINYHQLDWNFDIEQLLIVTVERGDVVQAFDLATGQKVAEYGGTFPQQPVYFTLHPYNFMSLRPDRYGWSGETLWNLETQTQIILDVPFTAYKFDFMPPLMNTNQQYIILSGSDLDAVYIWDLSQLIGESPSRANYIIYDELYRVASLNARDTIYTSRNTTQPEHAERDRIQITNYYYNFVTGEPRTYSYTTWDRR